MVHLHAAGVSTRRIATQVGCSIKTVRFWIRRYNLVGHARTTKPAGRPLLLDAAAARRAVQLLVEGSNGGARFVSRQLLSEDLTDRLVSPATVLRAAKQQAKADGDPLVLRRGRPPKALSDVTKNKRLDFAKANKRRSWARVMFTDRCKFHFRYPGCSVRQCRWLKSSQKHQDGACKANHAAVYDVYGGITRYGTTKLHVVTGTTGTRTCYKNLQGKAARNITRAEYSDVMTKTLLKEGKKLFGGQGMAVWTYQQDNDPTHARAAEVIQAHNKQHNGCVVDLLPGWPGNSPDLSPIENVWAYVDAEVARMGCKTFEDFKAAVDMTFENIPRDMCAKLIASVPKRLSRCVDRAGAKTGY